MSTSGNDIIKTETVAKISVYSKILNDLLRLTVSNDLIWRQDQHGQYTSSWGEHFFIAPSISCVKVKYGPEGRYVDLVTSTEDVSVACELSNEIARRLSKLDVLCEALQKAVR